MSRKYLNSRKITCSCLYARNTSSMFKNPEALKPGGMLVYGALGMELQ